MRFDKGIYLTFTLAAVCILLTIVAISAQAEEQPPQPEPVLSEVATRATDPARDLISRQLDAIRARNADLAWSMTTEDVHRKYDTPRDYLAHLRFKLRPIYNHADYKFIGPSGSESNMIQKLEMNDRSGEPVTVIYRLERENGNWLIDSFAILPHDDAEPI